MRHFATGYRHVWFDLGFELRVQVELRNSGPSFAVEVKTQRWSGAMLKEGVLCEKSPHPLALAQSGVLFFLFFLSIHPVPGIALKPPHSELL